MTPAKKWVTVDKLANNQPAKRKNGGMKLDAFRAVAFVFHGDMKYWRSKVRGKDLF